MVFDVMDKVLVKFFAFHDIIKRNIDTACFPLKVELLALNREDAMT